MATRIEPFGYFRLVDLDHWENCSSKDEGAVALYEQSVIDSLLLRIRVLRGIAIRWEYMKANAKETFLSSQTLSSECADMRTVWEFPKLICSGPVGGFIPVDEAIDIEIEKLKGEQE